MNVVSEASDRIAGQLDALLDRLIAQLRLHIPEVACQVHHGSNDHFRWWVTARLRNPRHETKMVDVSIECRANDSNCDLRADLAREDGMVLQELPTESVALPRGARSHGELTAETLARLENFLLGNVALFVSELASNPE